MVNVAWNSVRGWTGNAAESAGGSYPTTRRTRPAGGNLSQPTPHPIRRQLRRGDDQVTHEASRRGVRLVGCCDSACATKSKASESTGEFYGGKAARPVQKQAREGKKNVLTRWGRLVIDPVGRPCGMVSGCWAELRFRSPFRLG